MLIVATLRSTLFLDL